MQSKAANIKEYLASLPPERQEVMQKLRKQILDELPPDFEEVMNYGMIGYVVPHRVFPAGYHCNPKEPLPFMCIAAQKNFYALYHMGIYASPDLLNWFTTEYKKHCKTKLDMGKSCIRFKKPDDIPYALIGELVSKMTAQQWIDLYSNNLKRA